MNVQKKVLLKILREKNKETNFDGNVGGVQLKGFTGTIKVKVEEKMIISGNCLWIDGERE